MSGHKRATVTISQEEMQRLKEASNRLTQVEQDYQEIRQKIQTRREDDSVQFIQQVVDRQENFRNALSSVHLDVQALEWQTSQALIDQAEFVSNQVQVAGQDLWDNTQTLVYNHIQTISDVMAENQAAYQSHLDQLNNELNRIKSNQKNRMDLALQAINTAQGYLEAIHHSYPHNYYFPDALNNLSSDLDLARSNYENGVYEAALLCAQQTYRKAAILRLSIEEQIQKVNIIRNSVNEQVLFLVQSINDHSIVNALDLHGNELDIQVNVDFWTGGCLLELEQRCKVIQSQLNDIDSPLEYDNLITLQNEIIPQLNQQLNDIIFESRVNILASQLRMNIAQKIIDALNNQGFEMQESGYQTLDQRNPYYARLKAYDGSEVYIRVDPTQNCEMQQIHIQSTDADYYSDNEARQRARAIFKSLQLSGLQIGNTQISNQYLVSDSQSYYDTRRIRNHISSK